MSMFVQSKMRAFLIKWILGWRGKLIGLGTLILAVLSYGKVQKRKGVIKERERTEEAHQAAVQDAKEKTDEAIKHVGSLSDDDVKRVLGNRWTRN